MTGDLAASVIIPARNSAAWIEEQLESLTAQRDAPAFEILVCDNGSTDDTAARASAFPAPFPVRVIDASQRPSASWARNIGAGAAASDILLFCDSDDMVSPDWVRSLVDAVVSSGGAIVAGAIHHQRFNDEDVLAAYGIGPDPVVAAADPDEPPFSRDAPPFAGFMPTAGGGNFAMMRDDYLRLGGMDPSYPGGSEETDFTWRAQLAGIPLVTADRAVIHYRLKHTARELFRQQRIQQRARVLLWLRYGELGMVGPSFRVSALTVGRELIALPVSARSRRGRLAAARVLGGHIGALQGMFTYRLLRRLPAREVSG